MHCYRLQKQQRKASKVAVEEALAPMKDEEPKKEEGDQMIQGVQVVDSPGNVGA